MVTLEWRSFLLKVVIVLNCAELAENSESEGESWAVIGA
jgi:hypothetical protein